MVLGIKIPSHKKIEKKKKKRDLVSSQSEVVVVKPKKGVKNTPKKSCKMITKSC